MVAFKPVAVKFPISRDPPEGGTLHNRPEVCKKRRVPRFQLLGIPPKGEPLQVDLADPALPGFQFLGIPPKGEHVGKVINCQEELITFPISRDPPEGGTFAVRLSLHPNGVRFQFLGIPPKGERHFCWGEATRNGTRFPISRDPPEGGTSTVAQPHRRRRRFQFLGIPPKGELDPNLGLAAPAPAAFPISRDPPEGGTRGAGPSLGRGVLP